MKETRDASAVAHASRRATRSQDQQLSLTGGKPGTEHRLLSPERAADLATYTEHRLEHWAFIESAGVPVRRDPLMRLLADWEAANKRWFADAMIRPYILLTPPGSPTRLGETAGVGSFGQPLEIRLRPSLLEGTHPKVHGSAEGCYRFVADVLLHETLHQWQMEILRNDEDAWHGHGPQFTAQCNLIGADLGLEPVVVRNRKGSKLPRSANWPHNVRPLEYYLGAYDPDESVPDPGAESVPDPPPMMMPCPHCAGTGQLPAATDAEQA